MGVLGKILSLSYDSAEAVKEIVPKVNFYSVRLLKIGGYAAVADYVNPLNNSNATNILLNGKCIDKETRCLYVFYIDTYFQSAWILEVQIDTRTVTVVYYDKNNDIGFDPLYKIYNARIAYGRIIWTDNKNHIYQMDINRAKKSFLFGIGYDPYPDTAEWNGVKSYMTGENVSSGSAFYKCLYPNTNQQPSITSSFWRYLCPVKDAYYSMKVENFLFAATPPKLAPIVEYRSDAERRINNLKQTLFQIAYNYIYLDYRESTYSPASIVPLPQGEEEFSTGYANEDISKNNSLMIRVNTGGEEVRKIRIIGRSSIDPSKWFIIDEIDKFAEAESLTMGATDSESNLGNAEVNEITIEVPQPIVSNTSVALAEYLTIELEAKDPTVTNYYITASDDDMYWEWDERF